MNVISWPGENIFTGCEKNMRKQINSADSASKFRTLLCGFCLKVTFCKRNTVDVNFLSAIWFFKTYYAKCLFPVVTDE